MKNDLLGTITSRYYVWNVEDNVHKQVLKFSQEFIFAIEEDSRN